jgi:hypothetical protein
MKNPKSFSLTALGQGTIKIRGCCTDSPISKAKKPKKPQRIKHIQYV